MEGAASCNTGHAICDIAYVARQPSRGEDADVAAVAVVAEFTRASARDVQTLRGRELTAAKTDSGSDPGCNRPSSLAGMTDGRVGVAHNPTRIPCLSVRTQLGYPLMAVTLEGLSPVQAPGDLAHGNGAPDQRALELVGELQRQLPDARVLLFGSRAIGDWRPGSDIDLAVIGGSKDAATDALAQLRSREPHPRAQLFHFTATEFDELRTSLPHVAGQVQAHGLTAAGEHLPPMAQDNSWPGVQERLHAARRKLEAALILFGTQPLTGEIVLSVHATLERCLKAALGVEGVDFRDHLPRNRQHNLCALAELLAAETPVDSTDVMLVEYLHELDAYQDTAPYKHDQQVEWPTTDNETLLAAAQRASLGLAGHALAMLGKTPRDIGYEHHIGGDALGGFGTVALDYYTHAKVGARERQHIENAGRVRDLHTLLGSRLTESQLARVESNWYTHNAPDDVLERLVAVMTNPATWLDLLVTTRYRENDADVPEVGDTPPPKGW